MTRKALPKAITRSIEHLHEVRSVERIGKQRVAPALSSVDEEFTAERGPFPQNAPEVQPSLRADMEAFEQEAASSPEINAEPQTLRRRAEAKRIVERYKMYAAVGGLVPLALVNVASVTAIILRMIKSLSDLYQVPFERDRTRSFVVGLTGGAVPTGLAAATASTLSFVMPASGFVGLAISSISAGAFTRGIGLVFIDHFEKIAAPSRLNNKQ